MTLLSLLCVLVLEQIKATPAAQVFAAFSAYARFLERRFNGGEMRHGLIAWIVGVGLPALMTFIVHYVLEAIHVVLAFGFDVLVLYFLLGFRQFSHYFTDIQLALRMGELEHARRLLAEWRGQTEERLGPAAISQLAIEQGILSSHRHVFAPLFWFLLFGPAGAVLYRLALTTAEAWRFNAGAPETEAPFGSFARRAFDALDWLPARMTAATFAIVGDFEDAIYCWRTQAAQWPDAAAGILLASGAGALGIRLGQPLSIEDEGMVRPGLGLGDDADVEHLQSAIGLVWRALVLCLLLLALLTLARWVG
ncbi:CobD/CbiB family protein [Sulfuricystis multivorans]|uniref:CobD/CbiB family protein n=1 Tax=Sulfuricystis multivorans TaxID=2211108 RepID=UPI000F82F2F2|nr:CobD/CbiB family protein [Sulfuricystis multivorans]